jgi:hypothetical protein
MGGDTIKVSPADLNGAYMRLAPPERWQYGWVMSVATLDAIRQLPGEHLISSPPVDADGCWVVLGLPVRLADAAPPGATLERLQRKPR